MTPYLGYNVHFSQRYLVHLAKGTLPQELPARQVTVVKIGGQFHLAGQYPHTTRHTYTDGIRWRDVLPWLVSVERLDF